MARKPRSEPRESGRPGSPRARLFVALDLPDEARSALLAWRAEALSGRADLRPVAAEALHVTLVFLGYRAEKEIAAIGTAARSAVEELPAPRLSFGAVRAVGPRREPRLFALELDDIEERCGRVQAAVSDALAAARFYTPEKRPFWPHVTVARVKRGARAEPLPAEPPEGEPFEARTVTLYRSHLSPHGARYEALKSYDLVT